MKLRNVGGEKKRRRAEEEAAAAVIEEKKDAAAARKATEEAARATAISGFEQCEATRVEGKCACRPVCEYAKWVRCPTCGPKSGMCRVRACVEACNGPTPLLLGHTEE